MIQMIDTPHSSNVSQIGYDAASKMLRVKFKSGGMYEYAGFPLEEWLAFKDAPSLGKHFQTNIRGRYGYSRVE
jgi:hypothetical protein